MIAHMIELHCLIMWATMAEGRFGLTSQAAESGFVIDGNCFVGTCGRSMIARRHVSLYGKSPIRIEERSARKRHVDQRSNLRSLLGFGQPAGKLDTRF